MAARSCGSSRRLRKNSVLWRPEFLQAAWRVRASLARSRSGKSSGPPRLRLIAGGQSRDAGPKAGRAASERTSQGKRVQFDLETWHALDMLARDRAMNFQELADEAFADLLRKHGRPVDLKDALKRSLKQAAPQNPPSGGKKPRRR